MTSRWPIYSATTTISSASIPSPPNRCRTGCRRRPVEVRERFERARQCLLQLRSAWANNQPLNSHPPLAIGGYLIVRELGRGGFGIVYLADDTGLARTVALKVQRPEAILSATLRDRFIREAKAAARLRHPNIAAVHNANQEGMLVWIASEYCDGGSLATWLEKREFAPSQQSISNFVATLAEALEYSHRHGILHRDLKPSNVLLQSVPAAGPTDVGSSEALSSFTPKLIDFGLAKLADAELSDTNAGAILGTPTYMSPEQAGGRLDRIGPATDIYGLGAILYEMLTGCPVFQGANSADTLRQIVSEEPIAPRKLRREISRDLEAICLKCLQKDPAHRYLSAARWRPTCGDSFRAIPRWRAR